MLIFLKEIALLDTCSVSLLQFSFLGLIFASRFGCMDDDSVGMHCQAVVTPEGDQFGSKNCRMFFDFLMPTCFMDARPTMLQA